MSPSPQRGSIDRHAGVNALPIGARIGDFEITGVIRQGAFSIVYSAVQRGAKRRIAIKEYLPTMLADRMADGSVVVRSLRHQDAFRAGMQGFLDEAQALAAIDAPALVKVLQSWEQHGTAYMAMPLVEGRTLKDVLRESPHPAELWLKALVAPILDALAALHAMKRYPRDVSPDNVVVLPDGSPVLLDYGAARRVIAGLADDVTVVFKPGFTPIEQYAHDPAMPEGPWTDVYSVAAVLCFAITGKPPPTPATRLVADTMRPLGDMVSGYSEMFLEGIDRGLAVRPEHRPQDIGAFRSSLGIATVTSIDAPRRMAASADAAKTMRIPDASMKARGGSFEGTRVAVLGDGSLPPAGPELVVPPPPPDTGPRRGAMPWKAVVPLVAAAAVAVLAYVGLNGPSKPPTGAVETAAKARPVSPATTPAATSSAAQPQSASASSAGADMTAATGTVPVGGGTAAAGRDAPPPAQDATTTAAGGTAIPNAGPASKPPPTVAAAPAAAPAPRTAKLQFAIKPWGEIVIDGRVRGLSPPIKELPIPEGKHRIEVRNSTFPGYASEIDVKAGTSVSITHAFNP